MNYVSFAPQCVECLVCEHLPVGKRGCTLCNDELIIPEALAIEYGVLGLREYIVGHMFKSAADKREWVSQVKALRKRHDQKVDRHEHFCVAIGEE